jgi:ketosteroid isomerase-like protein
MPTPTRTGSTPTIDTTTAESVADISAVLAEHSAAHTARDAARLLALYAPEAVSFTLAPPLQQGPDTPYGTPEGLQRWFDTFDGPVEILYRDPDVVTSGDVAFVHCLTQMTATPLGSDESFSLWLRSTFGLRELGGRWLIVHRHESVPFHMDGSFRAATELQPMR